MNAFPASNNILMGEKQKNENINVCHYKFLNSFGQQIMKKNESLQNIIPTKWEV